MATVKQLEELDQFKFSYTFTGSGFILCFLAPDGKKYRQEHHCKLGDQWRLEQINYFLSAVYRGAVEEYMHRCGFSYNETQTYLRTLNVELPPIEFPALKKHWWSH